jgi:hypothetical protein
VRLDQVLGALVGTCQVLASELWPFVPDLAARAAAACDDVGGALPKPRPVFPRIEAPVSTVAPGAGVRGHPRQYAAVAAKDGAANSGAANTGAAADEPRVSEVA